MVASFVFCVYALHVSSGVFVAGMTVVTGLGDVIVSLVKAFLFGLGSRADRFATKGISGRRRTGRRRQRRQ